MSVVVLGTTKLLVELPVISATGFFMILLCTTLFSHARLKLGEKSKAVYLSKPSRHLREMYFLPAVTVYRQFVTRPQFSKPTMHLMRTQ
jgi:hypothetical protein